MATAEMFLMNPVHPGHDLAVTLAVIHGKKEAEDEILAALDGDTDRVAVAVEHYLDEEGRIEVQIQAGGDAYEWLRYKPGANPDEVKADVKRTIVEAQEWYDQYGDSEQSS